MNSYTNSEGELLIDAAALRFEAALDADSAHDRYMEDFYSDYRGDEDYYYQNPDECPHDDGTYAGSGDETATHGNFDCDQCGVEAVTTWTLNPETGWPERDDQK